jgi:hypothetical protein
MWQDLAACRDEPWQQFFTENQTAARAVAEKFCADCPVRQRCSEAADRRREVGVWAGSLRTRHPAYHRLPLLTGLVLEPLAGRNGRPLPAKGRPDVVVAWDELIDLGHTIEEASARLGISRDGVELARRRPRAKRAGRPRKRVAA